MQNAEGADSRTNTKSSQEMGSSGSSTTTTALSDPERAVYRASKMSRRPERAYILRPRPPNGWTTNTLSEEAAEQIGSNSTSSGTTGPAAAVL
jgi:hypothetical protein